MPLMEQTLLEINKAIITTYMTLRIADKSKTLTL